MVCESLQGFFLFYFILFFFFGGGGGRKEEGGEGDMYLSDRVKIHRESAS